MKSVKWVKYRNDNWCSFHKVDLTNVTTTGVYVIWNSDGVVRVGQGNIKDRITDHRDDPKINKHKNLKVTWAKIPSHELDGVENYLGQKYSPAVGDRFPDATPIAVNLPGK